MGSYDRRLCWFDMDLSTKPYKTLRLVNHYSLSEQPLTAFVKLSYGSEILQRQRIVRQRTEREIRVAEGEVGGSKIKTRLRTVLRG